MRYWLDALMVIVVRRRRIISLAPDQKAAYLALRRNGWFDAVWYVDVNPDVASSRIDPLHHLVKHGIAEGRPPRALHTIVDTLGPGLLEMRAGFLATTARLAPLNESPASDRPAPIEKGHLQRFSDRSVERAALRFRRFPLFRSEDYLAHNEPLRAEAGLVSHVHALVFGFSEGRTIFSRQTIANELGLRSRDGCTLEASDLTPDEPISASIVYNASGNSFLREFAECLTFDLIEAGHDVALLTEEDDPKAARDHNIIVAPQEFFFLGRGKDWVRDDVLSRSVLYNTEQPQTIWFDRAVPFNLLAKGVIDLAPQLAAIYGDCMPALFCDPTGPSLVDRVPAASDTLLRVLPAAAKTLGHRSSSLDERSIDVSFFGGISIHRERFFAKTARFFADYQTLIYCRRNDTPLATSGPLDLLEAARHVGFHSKIVLNVHREEFGFFEWHRIVRLGIETGAVVVSEPCLPHPELKPNVHYFEESGRHIQNLVEWLLRTPDGRAEAEAVRARALAHVNARRSSATSGRRIGRFLRNLQGDAT